MHPPPSRPVGVTLIAVFLGGTAILALALPVTLLLAGPAAGVRVPFLGALRRLDDPLVLGVLALQALLLCGAAAGLWTMRRAGLWLALAVGWLGLAFHLVGQWPWWGMPAAGEADRGGAFVVAALLLAFQDLMLLALLVLASVYLWHRRALFGRRR